MKRTILTAALAACALSATAQIMEERNPVPMTPGGGRVYRTEVVPYDARHDAEARNREAGGYWKAFEPEVTIATEGPLHAVLEQEIEIPFAWTDGMVYLHVENPGSAYSLWLNDRQVAEVSDPLTPAEFDLTPFIREGANDFKLLMRTTIPPGSSTPRPPLSASPSKTATSITRTNARSPISKSDWCPTRWGATSECSTLKS